jgi:hypothetical protein
MALCTVANLLTHSAGLALLFRSSLSTLSGVAVSSEPLASTVVDIAVAGLAHSRIEVRQMSAAVAYNLVLACTSDHNHIQKGASDSGSDCVSDVVPAAWRISRTAPSSTSSSSASSSSSGAGEDEGEGELPSHAVQLLCGSMESLGTETDGTVRYRRLAVACRIIRAAHSAASALGADLGFATSLLSADYSSEQEKQLAAELVRAFNAASV